MSSSIIEIQRASILDALRKAGKGQWKVLVLDDQSRRLVLNVLTEDDILSQHITNIEYIEQRRQQNNEMDAIYLLTPESYIVDCVLADLQCQRYRAASLLWTSVLHKNLREKIDASRTARTQILEFRTVDVGYWPKEAQLVTLRDPWSFPILYHPACNHLVREHLSDLARKIVSVCVSLGEYPTIRYYRPRVATHEASVLCSHLARFVQDEIDFYATYHDDFPPPSNRPRGALFITDRSMDLFAPLLHEFTYQAMIHDLLPVKDGEQTTFKTTINEGLPSQETKDVPITEKDKLWVANRHRHMKDTIDKLMGDFQRFLDENPHFANAAPDNANSLSAIKDMLAGLPQFQEMKGAYSLHLTMAQESMNVFQKRKLPDLASVEQTLATGFDEDHKKARGTADLVVRTLDEEAVVGPDRLRLILLFLLHRDGLLPADLAKLIAHAQLAPQDGEVARNLSNLGAHVNRSLKEVRQPAVSLFPAKPSAMDPSQEYSLSRFEPALQRMLEEHSAGTLDQELFPYTKPQLDPASPIAQAQQVSLRSAKPTWATSRTSSTLPKQRVLVFMAGGATYSESRACYEVSQQRNKEIYLATSHMLTPSLFVRQLGDLSVDRRQLGIPAEQPQKQAPAHLFEVERPIPATSSSQPKPKSSSVKQTNQPPTAQLGGLSLNNNNNSSNGHGTNHAALQAATVASGSQTSLSQTEMSKDEQQKKKRGLNKLFGKR